MTTIDSDIEALAATFASAAEVTPLPPWIPPPRDAAPPLAFARALPWAQTSREARANREPLGFVDALLTHPAVDPAGAVARVRFSSANGSGSQYVICLLPDGAWKCTCPDFTSRCAGESGLLCKHVLKAVRVLGLTYATDVWRWGQRLAPALCTPTGVKALVDGAAERSAAINVADASRSAALNAALHATTACALVAAGEAVATCDSVVRATLPVVVLRHSAALDDSCAVCQDRFDDGDGVVGCPTCRNPLHTTCATAWAVSERRHGRTVTCVWCRAPWPPVLPTAVAPTTPRYGAMNADDAAMAT